MSPLNPKASVKGDNVPNTEEPTSAHATPTVEKYIEKRNMKAEQQIKQEDDLNQSTEN